MKHREMFEKEMEMYLESYLDDHYFDDDEGRPEDTKALLEKMNRERTFFLKTIVFAEPAHEADIMTERLEENVVKTASLEDALEKMLDGFYDLPGDKQLYTQMSIHFELAEGMPGMTYETNLFIRKH